MLLVSFQPSFVLAYKKFVSFLTKVRTERKMSGGMYIVVVVVILATIALIIAAIWSVRSCSRACGKSNCSDSSCCGGPECLLSCDTSASWCGGTPSSSSSSSCRGRKRRCCLTGPTGPDGFLEYAQLWLSGASAGILSAGAPLALPLIAVGPTSGITVASNVITNLNATPGTVITLASAGVYEINWQAFLTSAPNGVALSLAIGDNATSLAQLAYTIVGSTSLSPSLSGSFLITAPADDTSLALVAALGNGSVLTIPATNSVTNISATTLSIKRVA
jgi:hypothetical protein